MLIIIPKGVMRNAAIRVCRKAAVKIDAMSKGKENHTSALTMTKLKKIGIMMSDMKIKDKMNGFLTIHFRLEMVSLRDERIHLSCCLRKPFHVDGASVRTWAVDWKTVL